MGFSLFAPSDAGESGLKLGHCRLWPFNEREEIKHGQRCFMFPFSNVRQHGSNVRHVTCQVIEQVIAGRLFAQSLRPGVLFAHW